MKKRSVVALSTVTAGFLVLAGAMPASAVVTYKATPESTINSVPALDSSTGLIYSAVQTQVDQDDYTETITATDSKTFKVKSSYLFASWIDDGPAGVNITDIRVNSKTHTVWIASQSAEGDNGQITELNGTTMKLVRTVAASNDSGYAPGEIAVNANTNTVYVAWAWYDWVDGSRSDTPFLEAINGSTGAISTTALSSGPSDEGGLYPYGYPGNIAFDSSNNGVYVAQGGHLYAYASSGLKLASTLTFPSTEATSNPTLTADGSTHTIYAVGASSLYKVAGSTNTVSSTTSIGSTVNTYPAIRPVVDPTIKTLYVSTSAYSEANLARTGTLPQSAVSVNGATHAIYSPGYVTTRSGS